MVRRARPTTQIVWDNADQQPALESLAAELRIYVPTLRRHQIGNVTRLILTLADATIRHGAEAMAELLRPILGEEPEIPMDETRRIDDKIRDQMAKFGF